MGTKLMFTAPRKIGYEEYEERPLAEGEVRLKTVCSGISAGTELTKYRGQNPYMEKYWDKDKKLFVNGQGQSVTYPLESGYEAVGKVTELGPGVSKVALGDVVYGGGWYKWSQKTTHILTEEAACAQRLPDGLDPRCGVFMALMQTSYNGVLDSQVNLGETAVVYGAGIVGQLTAQFLKLSGARVIVVDMIDSRLEMAKQLCADEVINSTKVDDVAAYIRSITANRGADVCVEATGNDQAMHEAIRCVGYSAKVVALGFNPKPASRLVLGDEFHHNRINLVSSQIGGVNPALSNRWDVFRVEEVVRSLMYEGKMNLLPMITNTFDFKDGQAAYDLVDQHTQDVMQVILTYT